MLDILRPLTIPIFARTPHDFYIKAYCYICLMQAYDHAFYFPSRGLPYANVLLTQDHRILPFQYRLASPDEISARRKHKVRLSHV